ncbi:hypothetical protein EVG20_g10476 [Dentipellis fragilis]|uniref:Uncharacterized protein n=1 Tax=Dentipellis fragilis TaxID=205917 RepID=A0A4Y9XT94_9AGAM|nr:hypothetical protein EVG20_g10476 [Dentipellis fragilis]
MATRGILGVLGMEGGGAAPQVGSKRKVEYEDVMRECENIRDEHDRRVDRAVRAVGMLREKYEWRARVEVEVEEPEELDFDEDSFMGGPDGMDVVGEQNGEENGGEFGSEGSSDGDEEELENVLGTGADGTPDHEPEDAVMTG